MRVIGTAGHVDHGKSSLVRALTGVDPDRWQEEKDRGLTIDLGFAELKLPSGRTADIVDVPGHERFIKNMLAGAGGIDLALLVVAADGGIMPQTREHLAIIDLLGVDLGVVAITRADLADSGMIARVQENVDELIATTSIRGAPVVVCSSTTGVGLPDLVAAIDEALASAPVTRELGRPRLPIDRAFTMPGFGTVVTGTLLDGSFAIGQTVEVSPAGLAGRVRGIQNNGRPAQQSMPGTRTALNLSGVSANELARGMVVALPGSLPPAMTLDARIKVVPYLANPMRHNLGVSVHTGAAEATGRLLLLDADEIPAGDSGWAQLRLRSPIAALVDDQLIVRDANGTLGGGRIVNLNPPRHRRFHPPTIKALEEALSGSPGQRLLSWIEAHQPATVEAAAAALGVDKPEGIIADLERESVIVVLDASTVYTTEGYAAVTATIERTLREFHVQFPLRAGMPRGELRQRISLTSRAFDTLLTSVGSIGTIRDGEAVALASFVPMLTPEQEKAAEAYISGLRSSPCSPPTDRPVDRDVLAYLILSGRVVDAGDNVVFAADAYDNMTESVLAHIRSHGPITLAQARDLFGTTRKYAQALLQAMDRQHLTRRVGDERVLYRPHS